MSNSKNILLIHGLWMTPLSWEKWAQRYTSEGYNVIAKPWPGVPDVDDDLQAFREDPSTVAGIGVTEIVDFYEGVLKDLHEPPIIIGHSFGGLIAQILLDRGYGSAGVAVATAPVKGILLLPFSSLRVAWYALENSFNTQKALPLTEEQFHYAFGNNLTDQESKAVYKRYAVPGPDHVLFQAAFANLNPHAATVVDFGNADRAPLLLIAGEKDNISPPSIIKHDLELYKKLSTATTSYKEFQNRTHYIVGERGWEEVADYALDWAAQNQKGAEMAFL